MEDSETTQFTIAFVPYHERHYEIGNIAFIFWYTVAMLGAVLAALGVLGVLGVI